MAFENGIMLAFGDGFEVSSPNCYLVKQMAFLRGYSLTTQALIIFINVQLMAALDAWYY